MEKIIGYIRVSTDEQATSGLGLDDQQAAIRAAAGREPDAWCEDDMSGSRADRPGLLAALGALTAGDVLIVAKRDRLARDMFLSCWIAKEVARRRATVRSAAGEGTENDDPTSILLRQIVDAFAEYERRVIGARTSAALKQKRARGERAGTLPWGYRVGVCSGHAPGDDRRGCACQTLISNETELAAFSLAVDRHAAGGHLTAIAEELNSFGYTTRAGRPWHKSAVRRLLAHA